MTRLARWILTHLHIHITGIHPPEGFIEALLLLIVMLTCGTVFYSKVEGWGYLDSLYFSVTTISTVGFGDLHPTNPVSKIFTMVYIFFGIGLGVFVLTTFAQSFIEGREQRKNRVKNVFKKILNNE